MPRVGSRQDTVEPGRPRQLNLQCRPLGSGRECMTPLEKTPLLCRSCSRPILGLSQGHAHLTTGPEEPGGGAETLGLGLQKCGHLLGHVASPPLTHGIGHSCREGPRPPLPARRWLADPLFV